MRLVPGAAMHGAAAHGSSFGGIIDLYLFP